MPEYLCISFFCCTFAPANCVFMSQEASIQLFENAKIRVVWDDVEEKYYFSVVDIIAVLTESANPQTYWRVLKKRLSDEGFETVTNCNALICRWRKKEGMWQKLLAIN